MEQTSSWFFLKNGNAEGNLKVTKIKLSSKWANRCNYSTRSPIPWLLLSPHDSGRSANVRLSLSSLHPILKQTFYTKVSEVAVHGTSEGRGNRWPFPGLPVEVVPREAAPGRRHDTGSWDVSVIRTATSQHKWQPPKWGYKSCSLDKSSSKSKSEISWHSTCHGMAREYGDTLAPLNTKTGSEWFST